MLIWYAAYGSNLLEERFSVYLRGGQAPGSARLQPGARDSSDPVGHMPYRMGLPLGFGQESASWGGGGVCFVDPATAPKLPGQPSGENAGETLGRAWLITVEQLADVWAQENGQAIDDSPTIDVERLIAAGSLHFESLSSGRGWYPQLSYLGELEGHPVATITCDTMPPPNAAGAAYLEVVGRGLIETWDLSPADAAHYLATRRGNAGQVDQVELQRLLSDRRA